MQVGTKALATKKRDDNVHLCKNTWLCVIRGRTWGTKIPDAKPLIIRHVWDAMQWVKEDVPDKNCAYPFLVSGCTQTGEFVWFKQERWCLFAWWPIAQCVVVLSSCSAMYVASRTSFFDIPYIPRLSHIPLDALLSLSKAGEYKGADWVWNPLWLPIVLFIPRD